MTKNPPYFGAIALVLAAGVSAVSAQTPALASEQPTVAASGTPTAMDEQKAAQMVQKGASERHLAPHDTFYMLTYFAVKTDKGVEGFDPGQEVHLVEVRRPTHTLIVSDGRAQAEVSPAQLTNDVDLAALARQKDQANQRRVAAYSQQQKEAYDKYEKSVAESTQKDLDHREKAQQAAVAEKVKEENTPVASTAPSANVPLSGPDYYGEGGYGYGNPYSYFVNTTTKAPAAATHDVASGNVAAPAAGHAGGGGKGK